MNMTEEQFERYITAYENRTEEIAGVASNLGDIASSIRGMYDGTSTSALWGISQSLFCMVDADRTGDGLRVIHRKDKDE